MSKVRSNDFAGTDHPWSSSGFDIRIFECPALRSRSSARGRASRSDEIQGNHGLVPGRIARANVGPPQLGPPFAESGEPAHASGSSPWAAVGRSAPEQSSLAAPGHSGVWAVPRFETRTLSKTEQRRPVGHDWLCVTGCPRPWCPMKWRPQFSPELRPFDGLTRVANRTGGLAVTLGRPLVRVPAADSGVRSGS
jgi:hypothetical protein